MVVFPSSSSSSSFFLLCRYVVPGSCLSKYPSNDTADPLHQPDDRTGEKLMVEVRAKNQNKVKAKNKGIINSWGICLMIPRICSKQIVSSTISPNASPAAQQ